MLQATSRSSQGFLGPEEVISNYRGALGLLEQVELLRVLKHLVVVILLYVHRKIALLGL